MGKTIIDQYNDPPICLRTNRAGDVTAFDAYLGVGCAAGEDLPEAIAAFREKRPGRYHDR